MLLDDKLELVNNKVVDNWDMNIWMQGVCKKPTGLYWTDPVHVLQVAVQLLLSTSQILFIFLSINLSILFFNTFKPLLCITSPGNVF